MGALFTKGSGKDGLGSHFCSASVVHSKTGNLVLTAAHCVSPAQASSILFVPDYNDGKAPLGVWQVSRVYEGSGWLSSRDPDDDVALLVVDKPGSRERIEDLTGGERLPASAPASGTVVDVTAYPDGANGPVACRNSETLYSSSQLQFDCGGFTDGTSGSPLLADVNASTGLGTVLGAIGGYEQGGDTPSVSYAAVLGSNVEALYQRAEAAG